MAVGNGSQSSLLLQGDVTHFFLPPSGFLPAVCMVEQVFCLLNHEVTSLLSSSSCYSWTACCPLLELYKKGTGEGRMGEDYPGHDPGQLCYRHIIVIIVGGCKKSVGSTNRKINLPIIGWNRLQAMYMRNERF